MNQLFKFFLSAVAVAMVTVSAFAQVTTSSINGHVTDEAGDPLVGAAVIAVHVPSGTTYSAVANNEGRIIINGMRAGGPYKIEVSFLGMGTVEIKDATLKLGEPYEMDIVMKSSSELEAVVLTAESSFNSKKTGAGASFSQRAVENMPTVDRSIYDIVKYTPQATLNKDGGISFAGSNNRYNSFQVDGAVANDSFGLAKTGTNGGQTGANPIALDAIEEIQVVVAPFDVRQSGFTGGAINAITKSGTNTVKGSFYTYFNNQDFIGTTPGPLDEGQTREKYDTQLLQTYGFTVGAPIIKNKLFIFASAEYYKKTYPNVYSPENGTYEDRTLNSPIVIDGKDYGSTFTPDIAQMMINHYENTYGVANTGESYSLHQVTDQSINAMARLDWNINNDNKLMLRYQFMDAFADQYGSSRNTYYFNNSSYKQSNRTHTIVAELNSRVSDEVSNEFRATAVLVRDKRTIPYNGAGIYIQDDFTVSMGTEYSSGANSMNSNTFTIADNVSIFKGSHNITAGTHNEFYTFDNVFLQAAFGSYTFSTINDFFNNNPNKYEYRYSDPELTGGNTRWAAPTYAAQFGLYAQDEWKPNRDFTLTYGLRVDMPILLNKPTANAEFNESEISQRTGEKVGVTPKPVVLFSPRIGFRWYADKQHNTLIRGGAGLFTGRVPFVWLSNAYNNTGMEAKGLTVTNPDVAGGFPLTSNPYDDVVASGLAKAEGKATINTMSKNFKYPQVFRANLALEQSFGDGWKFTFDALYSKNLNNVFFQNLALTKDGDIYAVNKTVADSNPASVAPHYAIDKSYYAVVALKNTSKGFTYSFSGQIEKHFDFGLDLMAAYTFGHSYSVNDGTSSVAYSNWKYNNGVDTNNPELSYSLFDRPHKVMAVVSYTTPMYLRGMQTTISLSYQGMSGQRHSYTMTNAGDFNGDGQNANSVLYIPTQSEITQMSWANPADAAKFEQYIRSNKYMSSHRGQWSERYAGITPFENHIDLHIAQDFYYDKEHGRKLQFFCDFMNLTNAFNREWGMYYSGAFSLQVLDYVSSVKDSDGNYTPTYKFNPKELNISDFDSRWRCQLGFRLTF